MAEKIGIEQLKKSLTVLAKVTGAIDKALEDGKVNIAEGIGIAFKAVDLIGVIKNLKQARAELADLSELEIVELTEHFSTEFDLRNEEAEQMVEVILELALQIVVSMELLPKIKTE